jgi:ATP-dependent protease ClpP protease subunit
MVHEVLTGSGNTKVSDVNIDTNHALDLNKKLFSILDNNCGKPKGFFYKQIESNKNSNLYLDAKQAKKLGIVDHVDSPTLNISREYSIATLESMSK